jgi:hypothetical protein
MMKRVFSTFLFLLSAVALADVTGKGDTGFTLVITGEVNTTPAEAYDQFIRIEEWWLEGHTWYGRSENLSIEPKAGGCFCEISGDNQVLHMLVSYVQPGVELKMVGGLGSLQMMGVHGGMSWRTMAKKLQAIASTGMFFGKSRLNNHLQLTTVFD